MDVSTQNIISAILVGLITYIVVWFSFYMSRDTLLYYRHEDVKVYLPVSSNSITQLAFFVAVVATFASLLAFF